ncbi:MAG: Uncharacterized protein XD63_1116 [Thermoanaerobacterales bacterium 50_218]|nr:MAG: Uncharacterized protein XD63_1116 [Thermoanaerobacterales bacterium 50_218]HAA89178.1 hypothetical protein [Peptococcaceae bacterium]
MLVATDVAVALRCPNCGRIKFQGLSLFTFSAQKTVRFTCTCGTPLLVISTKDRRVFYIQLDCIMCEGRHLFQHTLREIWSSDVLSLACEETGIEVCFLGPPEEVKRCIEEQERSLKEMAEDLGFSDYFANPEVMYEVLDFLHNIAEEGKLSCECGNFQIEVEIFADRIELRCPGCGAMGIINAESEEDLETLKDTWEIRLTPGSLQFLRFGNIGGKKRRSKK